MNVSAEPGSIDPQISTDIVGGSVNDVITEGLLKMDKNKKVTDNHTILDVLKILCRKMVLLGKKRGGIKMRNLLNRYLSNLMTFGLEKVATGAATKCCYFILHQPKVPENLKKFSESKK